MIKVIAVLVKQPRIVANLRGSGYIVSPGTEQLRTILLHELAHIKRGDLWISFGQTVLQIFYFYCPLLWLSNAVIHIYVSQSFGN